MRIAFDAYWWVSGPPSGRNVLISLVDTWSRRHRHPLLRRLFHALDTPASIAHLAWGTKALLLVPVVVAHYVEALTQTRPLLRRYNADAAPVARAWVRRSLPPLAAGGDGLWCWRAC